jgi:hypothetical protein
VLQLASVGLTGAAADAASSQPAINSTGQYITFTSEATNLVTGDTNATSDVFSYNYALKDDPAGPITRINFVSGQTNGLTQEAVMSGNGEFIAFVSQATNIAGTDAASSPVVARTYFVGLEAGTFGATATDNAAYHVITTTSAPDLNAGKIELDYAFNTVTNAVGGRVLSVSARLQQTGVAGAVELKLFDWNTLSFVSVPAALGGPMTIAGANNGPDALIDVDLTGYESQFVRNDGSMQIQFINAASSPTLSDGSALMVDYAYMQAGYDDVYVLSRSTGAHFVTVTADTALTMNPTGKNFFNRDTSAPTVKSMTDVASVVYESPDTLTVEFSEAVTGFTLDDVLISVDGIKIPLVEGVNALFSTSDNTIYTIDGLNGTLSSLGNYVFTVADQGTPIKDSSGNGLSGIKSETWAMRWSATLDDSSVGDPHGTFTKTGAWTVTSGPAATGYYSNSYATIGSDDWFGAATATWSFVNLSPGIYRVSAHWAAGGVSASPKAPFTVQDGTAAPLGTMPIERAQNVATNDVTFTDTGTVGFVDLGGPYVLTNDTLQVVLDNLHNVANDATVFADAVRIEKLGSVQIGDTVWSDANGNGLQNSEAGVGGVTVNLYRDTDHNNIANTATDLLVASTTTDASGKYSFYYDDVATRGYFLQFVAPSGKTFTTADVGADDSIDSDVTNTTDGFTSIFTRTAGTQDTTLDAGLVSSTKGAASKSAFAMDDLLSDLKKKEKKDATAAELDAFFDLLGAGL